MPENFVCRSTYAQDGMVVGGFIGWVGTGVGGRVLVWLCRVNGALGDGAGQDPGFSVGGGVWTHFGPAPPLDPPMWWCDGLGVLRYNLPVYIDLK